MPGSVFKIVVDEGDWGSPMANEATFETRHGVVEDDAFGLALGNRQTGDVCLREPHGPSWEAYGKQSNDRS